MTALPSDATKTHMDATTDDPAQARSELASLVDKFNDLLDYCSGLLGSDGVPATARTSLGLALLATLAAGHGVENDGSGNLRVKLDGSTLARSASGLKVADDAVDLAQMAHGAANRLVGRDASGVPAEIVAGTNVTISGGVISASGGIASVSQGDVNTSTGTVSVGGSNWYAAEDGNGGSAHWFFNSTTLASPGGLFVLGMETKRQSGEVSAIAAFIDGGGNSTSYTTRLMAAAGLTTSGTPNAGIAGRQTYISSSPPFDMGDGEAQGFLFLLMNKKGEIVAHYFADVPPWAYNGPTKVMADYRDPETQKKYRLKRPSLTKEMILDGVLPVVDCCSFEEKLKKELAKEISGAKVRKNAEMNIFVEKLPSIKRRLMDQYEEITQEIKNADMGIVPHPFGNIPKGHTVVMVDPYSEGVSNLNAALNYSSEGADMADDIVLSNLVIDNDFLEKRKNPQGVKQVKFKIR